MLRAVCAVVTGTVIALAASAAFAQRPVNSKVRAIDVLDEPVGPSRVMSVRSRYPATSPVTPTLLSGEGFLHSEGSGKPIWANGDLDGVSGLASQVSLAETADDLVLTEGFDYHIDQIELVMAVLPVGEVSAVLNVFEDCNGKPGALLATFPATEALNIGTNPGFPGLTFYRFVFGDLHLFQPGGVRWWLSPQGPDSGLYFWLTSGSGVVQGSQGQYRSAPYGFPDWTNVDETGSNFGLCTDFNFRVCGKACWKVHDTGDFSLSGFSSQGFPGGMIYLMNSFDNFQIPPGDNVSICRIEAWLATNCDPDRVYFELYDNDCDEPSGLPLRIDHTSASWRDPEPVLQGEFPLLVEGLPVYKFVIECPGVELREGRNYWMTAALHWVGTPHERALWLFGPLGACSDDPTVALGGGAEYRVEISEGRFRSDFLGVPYFAPISEVLNEDGDEVDLGISTDPSRRRDFAFRLWLSKATGDMLGNPSFSIEGVGAWEGQLIDPETPLPSLPAPPQGGPGGTRP